MERLNRLRHAAALSALLFAATGPVAAAGLTDLLMSQVGVSQPQAEGVAGACKGPQRDKDQLQARRSMSRSIDSQTRERRGTRARRRRAVRHLLITLGLSLGAPWALAAPGGGVIVGGSGSIDTSNGQQLITQTSDRLAIDWQQFSLAPGERTDNARCPWPTRRKPRSVSPVIIANRAGSWPARMSRRRKSATGASRSR